MFSYEERIKAVELLIQYDCSYAAVIHELGYPSREALRKWYYEYRKNGNIHEKHKCGYSTAEKKAALEHYINHGRCISRTIKALGYPSRYQLHMWVDEAFPNRKKLYTGRNSEIEYTREKKEQAVIDFCLKDDTVTAQTIADKHSVSRVSLYQWKDPIDAWLEADRKIPRKQRHTVKRIYDRLRDECGFPGSYSSVKKYLLRLRWQSYGRASSYL